MGSGLRGGCAWFGAGAWMSERGRGRWACREEVDECGGGGGVEVEWSRVGGGGGIFV